MATTPARLGLLGDVHAEDEHLDRALAFFRGAGVELVISVGDLVDGRGDVDRCCALLAAAGAVAVRGNHDRWLLEDTQRTIPGATRRDRTAPATLAYLQGLPATARVDTAAGPLLVCHGVGDDDMVRLRGDTTGYALECIDELAALLAERTLRFVVGGHTHKPMIRHFPRRHAADLVFINAGTLKRGDAPGCVVLDVLAGTAAFHSLGPHGEVGPGDVRPLGAAWSA